MIGFALTGGGARGISHLGVIKAFEEFDLFPHVLAGTSAGAIVGSLYCSGYSPDSILDIIKKTKLLSVFKPSFSWKGLLSIEILGNLLTNHLPDSFEDLDRPFYATATEIKAGKTMYFSSGPLVKAIMASACIPVIFQPVQIDGKMYVDGGILNNLPAEAIRDKVNTLVGISCNPGGYQPDLTNIKALMERSALLAINGNTLVSRKLCDIFLEPPRLSRFSGFSLSHADEIFKAGYGYALRELPALLEKLNVQ